MHIPDQMVNGAVCPVTAVLSTTGIAAAAYFAYKAKEKPSASRIGAVAAFIFAAQMMNFPVQNGTSGHLIGATLATTLLGMPFGVIVMAIVLTIQTLLFSDGGLTVLGANILNMALIGSLLGGIVHHAFLKKQDNQLVKNMILIGIAAWFSVLLAAFACSLELVFSRTSSFSEVVPAMLGIHMSIGIGEALITIAAYVLFSTKANKVSSKSAFVLPLLLAGIIGLVLSPFASGFPDGLEWVAERLNFIHQSAPAFINILPDYTFPLIKNEVISTGIAGIIGVTITFLAVLVVGKLFYLTNKENQTF